MVVTGKGATNRIAPKGATIEHVKGPLGVLSSKLPLPKEGDKKVFIQESKNAFCNRRRIQIVGVPPGTSDKEISQILLQAFNVVYIYISDTCSAHVLFSSKEEASKALLFLKGKSFKGKPVQAGYSQSEFIFFVGNIPYFYTAMQFRNMVKTVGDIERIMLVRSEVTGQSKGYGFVEYTYKAAVDKAVSVLATVSKNLRVEKANPGLNEYYDLQSQTLFVTQFPPNTKSEQIEELVNKHCQVPFCKIPLDDVTRKECKYALIDCKTAEDAEMLWKKLDGAKINGGTMRISFSPPGRLAATLLGGQEPQQPAPQKPAVSSSTSTKEDPKLGPDSVKSSKSAPTSASGTSTVSSPQKKGGLLASSPATRPQHRPVNPQGLSPRFPPGHPRFRPPQNSFDMDAANISVGPQDSPPDGPRGRGAPRMLNPRGPTGPIPTRGFMHSPNARPPEPLMMLPHAPEQFEARGPRPMGNMRGELRPERPKFEGNSPNSMIRGPREPHLRGRNPDFRGQRHPGPRFSAPQDFDKMEAVRGGSQNEKFDKSERQFQRRSVPDQKQLPERDSNRHVSPSHHHTFDQGPSPGHHFTQQRQNSPEHSFVNERPMWAEGARSMEDSMYKEPPADGGRRHNRPIWDEDQRRDFDREKFNRNMGNAQRPEARSRNSQEFGGNPPPPYFQGDRDRPRDPQRQPWDNFEKGPNRPDLYGRDDFRDKDSHLGPESRRGPPTGPDDGWIHRHSPSRGRMQNEPRDTPNQRANFAEQPPWNQPEQDHRFKEPPQQYDRWQQQRELPGTRRHDEYHSDMNQARDSAPMTDRLHREDDSIRPHEWRQPQRPLLDERALPPRDQALGLPDYDRRQGRPPFDSRQESQTPRSMPDQGPPVQQQVGYPQDRQQHAPPNQPGGLQTPAQSDFKRDPFSASGPNEQPPPFRQQFGNQADDRGFPPPPWQQQRQQQLAPPSQPGGFQLQQPFAGPQQPPVQGLPQQGSSAPPQQPQQQYQQTPQQPQQPPPHQQQQPPPHQQQQQTPHQQQQPPPPHHPQQQQPPPPQHPQQQPPPHPPQQQPPPHHPPPHHPQQQQPPQQQQQPPQQQPPLLSGPGYAQMMQNQPPSFPPQSQPPSTFLPTSAPVVTSASTSIAVSMPSIPGMPAFQMPPVQSGGLMPMTGGPLDAQQGMPPVASQQPSFVQGQSNIPPQQSSSQLDAYVAAASAAQQYAQYYEQLAKQHEALSQQPSAPGSKDSATLASQAKAYAQYYQQYYQHMQSILQLAKTKPPSSGSVQLQQQPQVPSAQPVPPAMHGQVPASQAPPQQPPLPPQGIQQNSMMGMQANQPMPMQQGAIPPWQAQQGGLPSSAAAPLPVGSVPPQSGMPVQSQQIGMNQLQQQQPQQGAQLPPGSIAQPWQMVNQPPANTLSSQLPPQPQQQPRFGGQLPAQNQLLGPQQQQMQQQQYPASSYGLQQPPAVGQQAMGQQPGMQQIRGQPPNGQQVSGQQVVGQQATAQASAAASGMNWMYSVTQTTSSIKPQHFSRPILYSSPSAQPRDQAGDKRQSEAKAPVYGPHKRPRF